ncbi:MAG: hypothetical protein KDA96_01605 [Planctomycetaceae bacterium]|nr:hypothetical protein [Planctomycetaceae bacterium]
MENLKRRLRKVVEIRLPLWITKLACRITHLLVAMKVAQLKAVLPKVAQPKAVLLKKLLLLLSSDQLV